MKLTQPLRYDSVHLLAFKQYRIWFFRADPIAFAENDDVTASENFHKSGVMGTVLNSIVPDKKQRLPREDFLVEMRKFEDKITPFMISEPEILLGVN